MHATPCPAESTEALFSLEHCSTTCYKVKAAIQFLTRRSFRFKASAFGLNPLPHLFDGRAKVPVFEEAGAADEGVGSRSGALGGGQHINAAINADMIAEVLLATPGSGLL